MMSKANQTKVDIVPISKVKPNPNNPRIIKDEAFRKLVKSIISFPKMLHIRPIVVNDDMIILGGNMRLRACQEAGLKEIPIIKATDLTEEEQKEFIIKDNVGFGEWDWSALANEWESDKLNDWNLSVWIPQSEPTTNYGILEEEDGFEGKMNEMKDGVKKAIQIEFDREDYEEAQELIKYWRDQKFYIGKFIIEKLKEKKDKDV